MLYDVSAVLSLTNAATQLMRHQVANVTDLRAISLQPDGPKHKHAPIFPDYLC